MIIKETLWHRKSSIKLKTTNTMNCNRSNTILFILICFMFQACGQQVQYGKEPLSLEDFYFNLDLNQFFQDESIFRWNNEDGFMVSSEDVRLENDSLMPGFVQYSTRSRSESSPLARYAGVAFDDLGLLADWDDEKIMMVCGSSEYKTTEEIMTIINQLKKEYGANPELQKGGFSRNNTLYLIFEEDDKVIQFGINLPDVDFIEWPERNRGNSFWGDDDNEEEGPEKVVLDEKIEKKIEQKLQEKEENTCFLFITTPEMTEAMKAQSGRSGFLVNYWRD